jgi:RHS repeat-associated protein
VYNVSQDGSVKKRFSYDLDGGRDSESDWAGQFGYTGQMRIRRTSLWHYKARAYSPYLGRFLQTDPIGYGDGLNWYAYVSGDSVNNIDPSGLTEESVPSGPSDIEHPNYCDYYDCVTSRGRSITFDSAGGGFAFGGGSSTLYGSADGWSTDGQFGCFGSTCTVIAAIGSGGRGGAGLLNSFSSRWMRAEERRDRFGCGLQALRENGLSIALDTAGWSVVGVSLLVPIAPTAVVVAGVAIGTAGVIAGLSNLGSDPMNGSLSAGGSYIGRNAAAAEGLLRGGGVAVARRVGTIALLGSTINTARTTITSYEDCRADA